MVIFKKLKKRKISAIIQARMGSKRLPGKVLIPICGKSVLYHIVERLGFCKKISQIILAIPDTRENDILEEFAQKNSIKYYRGSEDDVLERFYWAAKENKCDVVVEVTADKPLIDTEIINLAIEEHLRNDCDYNFTHYPSNFLPIGLDAGIINFKALEMAHKVAKKDYQREHVTSYFHETPGAFKITTLTPPKRLKNPGLRLTLDTKEDLELIDKIYAALYKEGNIFGTKEIFDLLKKQPELKNINNHIVQRLC